MLQIRFLSSNKFKIAEAQAILDRAGVHVLPINLKIEELQTEDTKQLVKDKALKAFHMVGRPLFVEHTGLYLNYMNGLPGGLTQIFWDTLLADKFSEMFGNAPDCTVTAKTIIGYIDGKQFHHFEGSVPGKIVDTPRGNGDFQWDCVFMPDGYEQTFAELGDLKNEISMRRRALDSFADFLKLRGMA